MKQSYSGIILAGGENSRFGGINKALLDLDGKLLLDRILNVMKPYFEEIILITNNPELYLNWNIVTASDCFDIRCSLSGIHAGLLYANNPFVFVVSCDAPFINKDIINLLLEKHKPEIDILVPETSKGVEPLQAIYSKRCLKPIERSLINEDLKIINFFKYMRVEKICENQINKVDPEKISFFNINTTEDFKNALNIMQKK